MNSYQKAVVSITKEQEKIIGKNLAKNLISQINNLSFDENGNPVFANNANPKDILGEIVNQYAALFGQASVEVAKDAVREKSIGLGISDLPDNLK